MASVMSSTTEPPGKQRTVSLDDPRLLINRELSWLRFNARVFEEAQDPWHPLLERAKFLAICGSNMDEFFMTRTPRLQRRIARGSRDKSADGMTCFQQLTAIRKEVLKLLGRYWEYWYGSLVPALQKEGIAIRRVSELSRKRQRWCREFFTREILPLYSLPIPDFVHAFVSNLRVNLLVVARQPDGRESIHMVENPRHQLPRLVEVASGSTKPGNRGKTFVFLEDIIQESLDLLFPGSEIVSVHAFRLTRDAEIDLIMDESADFLDVVKRSVEGRRIGSPSRLQYQRGMPRRYVEMLSNFLGLPTNLIFQCDAPLGLVDLWQLLKLERPELKDKTFMPYSAPVLRKKENGDGGVLATIARSDLVIYHPYDGFDIIVDLFREAADDPDVLSMWITFYRIDADSPVVEAMIKAAENGKKVTALVELKAKFDEENNIILTRRLMSAGVRAIYRFPDLKVHAKLCLIERMEGGKVVRYSHIGSGNYNAVTTKIYGDIGYLTAGEKIGAELADLFRVLTEGVPKEDYQHLLVAPKSLRKEIIRRIDREIECHRRTGDGYLAFKLNGLEDVEIIRALYRASVAGVRVELNVRGLCCLRPGVPGASENITVISIVGRFLEHARIYYFRNGGQDEVLLGSSDMMFRNLSRRVEVLYSLPDDRIKRAVLETMLKIHLRDNTKARRLLPDGTYERVRPREGEEIINSQEWLIQNRGIWHHFERG